MKLVPREEMIAHLKKCPRVELNGVFWYSLSSLDICMCNECTALLEAGMIEHHPTISSLFCFKQS